jgi:hypothetical protein
VTTSNTTFQPDKRLFESDSNATVKAMATSQTSLENTCFTIFEKMINTVPKSVTLSDVIGPRKWITMFSFLDLTPRGVVTYSGTIGTYSKTAVPKKASYQYGYSSSGNTGLKSSQTGGEHSVVILSITI